MTYWRGVLYTIIILGLLKLAIVIVKDYQVRMVEYNAHVCSVYGKQPDCKTPLEGR